MREALACPTVRSVRPPTSGVNEACIEACIEACTEAHAEGESERG
jgi:hypothetical protein